MTTRRRLGLRIPSYIDHEITKAAEKDYTTKNQKAIEIFLKWIEEQKKDSNKA